jgi:hypothetical protein
MSRKKSIRTDNPSGAPPPAPGVFSTKPHPPRRLRSPVAIWIQSGTVQPRQIICGFVSGGPAETQAAKLYRAGERGPGFPER